VSWRTVLRWAAIAGIVEYIIVMALIERSFIPPVFVIGVLLVIGVVLLGRDGRAGVRLTTIAFVLFLISNLLFAGVDLTVPASFGSFAVTWIAVITGVVGVVAGIATWRGRDVSDAAGRIAVAGVGLAVVAVVIGLVASIGFSNAKPVSGDVVLRAKDSKFDKATLAVPSGKVSFFLDNADNALHNLHIVGVKGGTKTMPANHKARLTVTLSAGTYKYKCDYHTDMKGTLTVS
jgi:plastocyanin